jgi:hypothetical protein
MKRKDEAVLPARRTVLRGALAAGCSLLVPGALTGCTKKEEEAGAPEPAAPPPQSSVPPMGGAAPAAPAKVTQISVQYQTQPKGEQKCANCRYFIAPTACQLVEGEISPEGWCLLWAQQT